MLLLPNSVVVGVKPEGSEALFRPKNHSEGTILGRGLGVIVAEHIKERFLPAMLGPEGEMRTTPPKLTV